MQCRAVRISRVTLMAAVSSHALDRAVLEELDEDVVAPLVVHQGRARTAGGEHVGHRRQLLVVDLTSGGDVLGFGARAADAHGDDLADVAHLARRQDRLARMLEAAQRRRRADRLDAGKIRR